MSGWSRKPCFVLVFLASGCGSSPEAAPGAAPPGAPAAAEGGPGASWASVRWTQGRKYQVELATTPEPPVLGELFVMHAHLLDRDGLPIEDAKVALDARMPQHDHGMATDPVDEPGVCDTTGACSHPGGVYHTSGFKFHMTGDWTVTVDVTGPLGHDSTSFVVPMK